MDCQEGRNKPEAKDWNRESNREPSDAAECRVIGDLASPVKV